MTQNKVSKSIANALRGKTGHAVVYTTIALAPLFAAVTVKDMAITDVDHVDTVESTELTSTYTQQIRGLAQDRDRIVRMQAAVPNQQGSDAIESLFQDIETEIDALKANVNAFEESVLTNDVLTEKDYESVATLFHETGLAQKFPQPINAGDLNECRVNAQNGDQVAKCMDESYPSTIIATAWAGMGLAYIFLMLGLFANRMMGMEDTLPNKLAKRIDGARPK